MIDVDVETTGLQWYGDDLFLVQFSNGMRRADGSLLVTVLRHPEDRESIQHWLDNPTDRYRAWNTKFDMHFLESAGYRLPTKGRWEDGKVIAQLTDERVSSGLKRRAAIMFGEQERDPESALKDWLAGEIKRRRQAHKDDLYAWLEARGHPQKRNRLPQIPDGLEPPAELGWTPPNYSDVPDGIMRPYAAQDIVLTRRATDVLEPKLTGRLREVYELERKVLGALYDMERRGLPVDTAGAHRLALAASERLDRLERQAVELAGIPHFNPGAPRHVEEALRRHGADLTFVSKTPTGALRMDEENLSAVDHPLAQAVLDFRAEAKLLGTYVLPMIQAGEDRNHPFIAPDGRVHSTIWQVGARHGRMSSSDPNVQNWPRDDLRLRWLARAPEGKVLVAADMESIEMRLLAYYAGPGRLLAALKRGEDIHDLTAKMVGLKGRQRSSGFESARQQGKRMNFLTVYGGGVRALRKFFLVKQAVASQMKERYREAYPEIQNLQDRIAWKLADRGYIETYLGRRQRLEQSVGQEAYKFVNYLISGTAADLFKLAVVRLHEQGVPLVTVLHDEVVAEVDPGDATEVGRLMVEALTDFPDIAEHVPLGAEAKVVRRWSEAKQADFIPEHERSST